jgi:hypothetical protein
MLSTTSSFGSLLYYLQVTDLYPGILFTMCSLVATLRIEQNAFWIEVQYANEQTL